MPALQWLNERLIADAAACGFVPLWRGYRLVAADASVLMPAVRACHRSRVACADQRLFALYLPGAELTLYANVCSASDCERGMLVEALQRLGSDDVLLLDRGYPAAWLVQLLNEQGIRFVMRCDNSRGWAAVRDFMHGDQAQAQVRLNRPSAQEAKDWDCARLAPSVRLVRQVAPNGAVRVLATNLSAEQAPAECFGALYHQRWRIKEAFKRLKHRLHLEAVSGLSQQGLIVDVAAKVLADNIAALMCSAAQATIAEDKPMYRCNRTYACLFL